MSLVPFPVVPLQLLISERKDRLNEVTDLTIVRAVEGTLWTR